MKGVILIGKLSIEERKYCFSLIMYGFFGNNALYSAILLFAMFIFLLKHETVIVSNQIST